MHNKNRTFDPEHSSSGFSNEKFHSKGSGTKNASISAVSSEISHKIFGLNPSCAVDEFFALLADEGISTFVFYCPKGKDTFSYKVDDSKIQKLLLPKISRGKFGNEEIVNVVDLLFYLVVSTLALPYLLTFKKIIFKGPPFFNTLLQRVFWLFGKKTYLIIIDDQEKDMKVYGDTFLKHIYYQWSLRREVCAVRLATKVFVTSEYCYNKLRKYNKHIYHVPNGADVSSIQTVQAKKLQGTVLLYAGGFEPWRGLDLLIDAFKRLKKEHKDLKLYLIGGGPHYAQVHAYAAADNDIIFTGYLGHDDVIAHYKGADVLVMPSRNCVSSQTISSIKCFEYIASGVPCVVTDSGEHATWVKRCKAGLVVQDSVEGLYHGIGRLLTEKKLYAECKKNARKHAPEVDYKVLKQPFVEELKI